MTVQEVEENLKRLASDMALKSQLLDTTKMALSLTSDIALKSLSHGIWSFGLWSMNYASEVLYYIECIMCSCVCAVKYCMIQNA